MQNLQTVEQANKALQRNAHHAAQVWMGRVSALHGAFSAIKTSFGMLLPGLASTRQVIAFEMQAQHGRTADIDRSLSLEQMADDVAAAIRYLGVEGADILGCSMGAGVALQLVIRHRCTHARDHVSGRL